VQVREVMTKSPVCCPPDMPLKDVARLMRDFDCGEIPVVESAAKRPVGVVTDRDITCRAVAQGKDPSSMSASDCMTTPVVTVTPDTSIEECCRMMEERQIRRVPVVDEAGSCCGIVAQADLALRMANGQSAHVVREVSRPSHGTTGQQEGTMATDPVCGMRVSTTTAAASETYGGHTFYFCSAGCRARFMERPEDYAGRPEMHPDGTPAV
jgi:CBS domain-containing protein/YHS domain-containing protein